MKNFLTNEQETNLCSDYKNGIGFNELKQKYTTSTTQVYRLLKKYDIKPTRTLINFGPDDEFKTNYTTLTKEQLVLLYNTAYPNIKAKAARLGVKRPKDLVQFKHRDTSLDAQIISLYKDQKLSSTEIANRCGLKSRHIRNILEMNGVDRREASEYVRIYELDQNFFETIDTEEKAYFLGLIAADGNIDYNTNSISISLKATDRDIVDKFKKALKTTCPVIVHEFKTTNSKPQAALRLHSEKMKQDLVKHGVIPRKSLVLKFPTTVPDLLIHHYIRGMIDGDGEVSSCTTSHYNDHVNITSTREFLESTANKIKELAGVDKTGLYDRKTGENTWRLYYKSIKKLSPLYNFLYKDARLFLKRKHDNFLKILENYNSNKVNHIFLKKTEWVDFSPHKMAMLRLKTFNHYRMAGFPYIVLPVEKRINIFKNLQKTGENAGIINKELRSQSSCFLADSYFPHMYEVKCHDNCRSILDIFNDNTGLKRVIDSRIKYAEGIADNTIRRGLKFEGQPVCNFKSSAAKLIYEQYGGENCVTWDMCAGWGGRLIGALASKNVTKYVGTDPNTKNMNGYRQIYDDFKTQTNVKAEFHCIGSEDFLPEKESLDLCFTSPPYFDTEKYSDEPTQSYIKFPDKERWLNGFLKKTMQNCFHGLKPGKYMIINIANVSEYPELETDTIKAAQEVGFILSDTLKYRMAQTMFRKNEEQSFRYEPLFIFQKPFNLHQPQP